jgi:uncharacterized protein (TIGR04562 family)
MSEFPVATLKAIIAGSSAIDVPHLHVTSRDDAMAFAEAYGYDLRDPREAAQAASLRDEALDFLDEMLDVGRFVPGEVRAEEDVLELLLVASQPDHPHQRAVCALLRVMHTLAHCSSWFGDRYHDAIQRQVLGRFRRVLHTDDEGQLRIADVPLVRFEARARKERWSVALKLLHKPENVAADVFDYLGLRFVTRDRFDALRVVRALRTSNTIMFANIKPSRSRNTLIDTDHLEAFLALRPDASEEQLREAVDSWGPPGGDPERNPYSDAAYHSLQFTCRQRIRVTDEGGQRRHFFFPFEVQILDEDSYRRSREGFASHDEYKRRQVAAARRRVLPEQ